MTYWLILFYWFEKAEISFQVTLETILDWCNKTLPNQNMIPTGEQLIKRTVPLDLRK